MTTDRNARQAAKELLDALDAMLPCFDDTGGETDLAECMSTFGDDGLVGMAIEELRNALGEADEEVDAAAAAAHLKTIRKNAELGIHLTTALITVGRLHTAGAILLDNGDLTPSDKRTLENAMTPEAEQP